MSKMKKAIVLLLLSFSAIFFIVPQTFAWETSDEIRRLNSEAPSLDGYGDAEALIWLRNFDYKMLADGTMENTRRTVVMMGEYIPEDLQTITIPVPDSGKVVIEEAAWYNPMTGFKEGTLPVKRINFNGGFVADRISIPKETAGRAIVVIVRETVPKHYGIDASLRMAGIHPIWEQKITAEVPTGIELYWNGRDIRKPLIKKINGVDIYTWVIKNQPQWKGEGFVVYKCPTLTFSTKQGISSSLGELDKIAHQVPLLPFPINKSGSAEKTGYRLMKWISQPEHLLEEIPGNYVRPSSQIPVNGPWTSWERTIILNRWLEKLGWDTQIMWQTEERLNKKSATSFNTWKAPVINARYKSGKKAYYRAGQPEAFGIIPTSIAGSYLYKSDNSEYQSEFVPVGSASDNRLEFTWNLQLNENGKADGTLNMTVTGGWTQLLTHGDVPSKTKIASIIGRRMDFAIPGMSFIADSVTQTSTGYKVLFNVTCNPAIILANDMLVRLPGGVPRDVDSMIQSGEDYKLKYPFILDQSVKIQMPKGYNLIQTPPVKNIGEGSKAVLKENIYHWPKKAQLVADSTWVVKEINVTSMLSPLLKEELKALLRWPVIDLPFRK